MKFSLIFLIAVFILLSHTAFGQNGNKTIETRNVVWLGYFSRIKLSEKWGINSDVQWRRDYVTGEHLQNVFRTGVNYNLHPKVNLTTGFAYFRHYSANNNFKIIQPEYRPWQQLNFTQEIGRFNFTHRFRFEQRWRQEIVNDVLTDEFGFNFRIRYRFNVQLPINKKQIENKTLFLDVFDEVMINLGKEIETNYFDQNRLQLGLSYKLNENYRFQLSYLYLFATTNDPFDFRENNVIRFNFYHSINLQKKKPE